MLPGKEIFFVFIGSFLIQFTPASTTKRMYALCPPDFFGIGTECYYISSNKVNWLDAHFDCKDRKSRLAEPIKYEDRMIRKFLMNNDASRESKWIGGNYNWAKKKWQWQDGKEFTYQSFSQMPGGTQELKYHCAILNPDLSFRWSASSCIETHQYICQHRMPYVNEKHRSRIYARWNQTYPNLKASEVELVLDDVDMLKRGHRQSVPITGRTTNVQRLSKHRNYLASEWLKKFKTRQITINRNRIPEGKFDNSQQRIIPQRPNRLTPRRRNPNIGRDDFIQFERERSINRGALITNKVEDDFNTPEPVTTTAPTRNARRRFRVEFPTSPQRRNQVEEITSPPRRNKEDKITSPTRRYKHRKEVDLKEQKRLEETRKMLETGYYEPTYTAPITTPTTRTTSTETNVSIDDNERIEFERNRDLDIRRKQIEEERARRINEDRSQNQIDEESLANERIELERNRDLENRQNQIKNSRERQSNDEHLQNQINEETLTNEKIELERNREIENRRKQDEEARERQRNEEHLQNQIDEETLTKEKIELERNREIENRRKQAEEARERQRNEEHLQNQIDEETLRNEREEERRKSQLEEDEKRRADEDEKRRADEGEKRRADERQRIYEQTVKDREEKMRQRELELKEREEEEQKLQEDEERRQEENRQRLAEIERKQQEEQEKQRIDAENKRIEEENRRRKKEELKQKQKIKQNEISDSSEEQQLNDIRLKEKLRREKLARLKERIKNLSPEDQLKFFELRGRGKRNKKESDGKENETTTNQL